MKLEFKTGYFEFKSPNVIEGLRLKSEVKKSLPEDIGDEDVMASIIDKCRCLVTDVKIKNKKSTFEKLLEEEDAHDALIEFGDVMAKRLFLSSGAQKKSK